MGLLTELIRQEFENKRQDKELQMHGYAALLKQPDLKPDARDRVLAQMGKSAGSGKPVVDLLGAVLKKHGKQQAAPQESEPGPGVPSESGITKESATGADDLPETHTRVRVTSPGEAPSRGSRYSPGEMAYMARQKQEKDNQQALDLESKQLQMRGQMVLRNQHEGRMADLQDMGEINRRIASGETTDEVGQIEIGKIAGRTPEPTWKEGYFIPPAGDPVHVWYNTKKPNTYLDDQNKAVSLPQAKGWHFLAGEPKAPTEAASKDAELFAAYKKDQGITGDLTEDQKFAARKWASAEKSKSEEELTDESLHGATPEIRQRAKENLAAMQKRKVEIAKASKDTPSKSEEEKAVEETAQSLAKGDLTNIRDVTGMMSGQRLRVYARAKEINPNFSTSELQRQINMENFVTTGKMGDNIQAFGTFLEHAGNLSDVVQNIRLSGSPAVNKPLNWWREHMSGTHEYQELLTALEPVKKEYESFLLGNRE